MDVNERAVVLRRLHDAPLRLHRPIEIVRTIDTFLSDIYGIADPTTFEEVERKLQHASSSDRHASRILRVLEERNDAYATRRRTTDVDARFFDLMAVMPYAGWIHQLKRALILDSLVSLVTLASELSVCGPVLDIGCHAGYHALWLAANAGTPVTGIDRSRRALELARNLAEPHRAPARLEAGDFPNVPGPELFEFVYSIDGPFFFTRISPQVAAFFQHRLIDGGVFVVVGEGAPPFEKTIEIAREYGLHLMLTDVVGGWMGHQFDAATLLVFLKSDTTPVAPTTLDNCDSIWESHFRTYANLRSTPWREKTQAFCRAHALAQTTSLLRVHSNNEQPKS